MNEDEWRRLTVEIGEEGILDVGTRPKVDQLERKCFQVHQNVFILREREREKNEDVKTPEIISWNGPSVFTLISLWNTPAR